MSENVSQYENSVQRNSHAGRKSAMRKAQRSEAWWGARIRAPGYNIFYQNFLRRCVREHLSPTEWVVLDFIYDRTLGWDKEWEKITVRQFLRGSRPNDQGYRAFCGVGIKSETTLRKALTSLEVNGLIQVREHDGGARSFALTRLDRLIVEIEQASRPFGSQIRYRAKWPGQDEFIEIRSNL